MPNFASRFKSFFKQEDVPLNLESDTSAHTPSRFKFKQLLPVLALAVALPVALVVVQQQQDIRQRAASLTATAPVSPTPVPSYPITATISGPTKAKPGSPVVYSVTATSTQAAITVFKAYYAPVTPSGIKQDTWTEIPIYTSPSSSPQEAIGTTGLVAPPNGQYWVMVNVNDAAGNACTGNPSYTADELANIKLTPCGGESSLILVSSTATITPTPIAATPTAIQPSPTIPQPSPTPIACVKPSVRSVSFPNPCLFSRAKNSAAFVYYTCNDGYSSSLGNLFTCQTQDQWKQQAAAACAKRNSCIIPTPTPTTSVKSTSFSSPIGNPVNIQCALGDINCQRTVTITLINNTKNTLYTPTITTSGAGVKYYNQYGQIVTGKTMFNQVLNPGGGLGVTVQIKPPAVNIITRYYGSLIGDAKICTNPTNLANCIYAGGSTFDVTIDVYDPKAKKIAPR